TICPVLRRRTRMRTFRLVVRIVVSDAANGPRYSDTLCPDASDVHVAAVLVTPASPPLPVTSNCTSKSDGDPPLAGIHEPEVGAGWVEFPRCVDPLTCQPPSALICRLTAAKMFPDVVTATAFADNALPSK